MSKRAFSMCVWLLAASLSQVCSAQSSTVFTYQGSLSNGGGPASGSNDLDFSLWDAQSGGTQVGSTISLPGVAVNDGLVSVELDFGADALAGSPQWLQIAVDRVVLSPRQMITGAPFSIQTRGILIGDDGNVRFNSMNAIEGSVTMSSIGGIDLVLDADTNNVGEDQNARVVMKQDGGQVVGRMGFREGGNTLEFMQEYIDSIVLGTDNKDRLWVGPSGFVGVGRAGRVNPSEAFGVYANVATGFGGMYMETEGDVAQPYYGYSAGGDIDAYHYYDGNTGNWHLNNGGANRLTVASNGWVGIGTSVLNGKLSVESSSSATLYVSNVGGAPGGHEKGIAVWCAGDNGSAVSANHTATLGTTRGVVGSVSSDQGIGVEGNAYSNVGTNYGVRGRSDSPTGYDFYASGAGINYGSSSSRRWKNNIEPIANPLAKLAKLRGVYFDWDTEHGGHHDVGMIAEEVGKVLPEIVNYEENGVDAQGMDYSKLSPLLVEAVNALRKEKDAQIASLLTTNESLQRANQTLQMDNKDLHLRLDTLEQIVHNMNSAEKEPRQ